MTNVEFNDPLLVLVVIVIQLKPPYLVTIKIKREKIHFFCFSPIEA